MANPERRDRAASVFCEVDGSTVQLSLDQLYPSGLFLPTVRAYRLDHELRLLLRTPLGELTLRGQVVQVISREHAQASQRPQGVGVLFLDLEDDDRAFIGLTLDALDRARRAQKLAQENVSRARENSRPLTGPLGQAKAPPRPSLSPEGQQALSKLKAELALVASRTPREVLGLPPDAGAEAAREAYLAMAKRYHPHAFAHFDSAELSRIATELFIAHKRAYASLAVPVRKSQAHPEPSPVPARKPAAQVEPIARAPETAPTPMPRAVEPISVRRVAAQPRMLQPEPAPIMSGRPPAQDRRAVDAENAFQAGLRYLALERFDDAENELERVHKLCPDRSDAELYLHLCHARRLNADAQHDAALEHYRAVLAIDPEHREAADYIVARRPRKRAGLVGRWLGEDDE